MMNEIDFSGLEPYSIQPGAISELASGISAHDNSFDVPSATNCFLDDVGNGSTLDDDCWDASDEVVETSDLDREWEKRHEGFHTIGYRDGIIAGKEASAQEGFNFGFKESVNAGYRWGLVRGVTSALALLPNGMKEKLLETDTKKIQLQRLFESTSSVSTTDALKSFHDDIISKKRIEDGSNMTTSSPTSECLLDKYYRELTLLVKESPAINIQPLIDPKS